jgi:predicted methyltransferase
MLFSRTRRFRQNFAFRAASVRYAGAMTYMDHSLRLRRLMHLLVASATLCCTQTKEASAPAAQEPIAAVAAVSVNPAPEVSTSGVSAEAAASVSPASSDPIAAAVAAADRSAEDRALDAGRKPEQLLNFFQIKPGMRVAELAAGGGYTAELLARVVGPSGKVYGQNSKFLLERYAQAPWTERLRKPVNAGIVRLDRDFDVPLPEDVKNLDAVLMVLFYHDTVWMKTDRAKMNRSIFAALAPGGVFGVVDHSAKPGEGLTQVETLHRIEEPLVVKEIEAAGFKMEERASFLENPKDARDWSASPRKAGELRGTSDRFVYRFRKPLK